MRTEDGPGPVPIMVRAVSWLPAGWLVLVAVTTLARTPLAVGATWAVRVKVMGAWAVAVGTVPSAQTRVPAEGWWKV